MPAIAGIQKAPKCSITTTGIEVVMPHLGAFWMPAIASVELCHTLRNHLTRKLPKQELDNHTPAVASVSSFTRTNSNTKPPVAPGIDTRPVRTGVTRITTHPNKSPHLKSRMILNSNWYEPAEPNPATPNLPNEHPPNKHPHKHPPHEHPPNEHPPNENLPNENLPYEHHLPAKTRQSASRAWAKRLLPNQTVQTTHLLKRVFSLREDPPNEDIAYHTPASAGTFYCVISNPTNAQIRPRAKHRTMQPPIPPILDFRNIYEDKTNMAPHTRFGGCVAILGISTAQYPTQQMHRPGPKQNTGLRHPPYPQPLIFCNNETQNKYGTTHPPKQGYHTIDTAHDVPPPLKTGRTPNEAREGTTHPLGQVCGATR
ncbi:hypothetical protein BS47DRAFT_1366044 [Hydnum rufescens UP504]|uniref:Uncharacterized protein n=1 Tax=Hydnum rufescens UP504 TaxID=1448309 RepID=A0A9P6AMN4_9AGAM|nr:hypothetical protein BS47DRAFT_1366044 [Hydnum rufescens UP504]